MRKMTTRQDRFVSEFIICGNAAEAARRAGYEREAKAQGERLMRSPTVRKELDARQSELREQF